MYAIRKLLRDHFPGDDRQDTESGDVFQRDGAAHNARDRRERKDPLLPRGVQAGG